MNWDQTTIHNIVGHLQPLIVLVLALLLDKYFGEPRRFHPLVGFGKLANTIEKQFYGTDSLANNQRRLRGILALALAVLPLSLITSIVYLPTPLQLLFEIFVLYFAIGANSLETHAHRIIEPLKNNDLHSARKNIAMIVSRDTSKMQQPEIIRATVESVLENGNDAIFAAIFWYLLAGIPGVLAYRLINTLDAMWGYRNQRYRYFGWAAARLDDVINWLPARLCALTYALLGNWELALRSWRHQAAKWDSPNAGPVIAAGAGALGVSLGGEAIYGGLVHHRPVVGNGPEPKLADIAKSIHLINRGIIVWLIIAALGVWYFA